VRSLGRGMQPIIKTLFRCTAGNANMKRCLAFSALVGSRDAWRPCSRRAVPGSQFCGRHTEVVAGIMLGLCVHGRLERAEPPAKAKNPGKSSAPAPLGPAPRRN